MKVGDWIVPRHVDKPTRRDIYVVIGEPRVLPPPVGGSDEILTLRPLEPGGGQFGGKDAQGPVSSFRRIRTEEERVAEALMGDDPWR